MSDSLEEPRSGLPRGVGRPRSESTHQAILTAAVDLLENETYQSISINRIAEQAGVSKQTIYRWWDTKADLVLEAYTRRVFRQLERAELGADALRDLERLLVAFFTTLADPHVDRTLRSLIAEAQFDPVFRTKFHAVFVSTRRNLMRQVLEYGVGLGQIRPDADLDLVLDVIYGAFWYRLLSGSTAPLDAAFARALVELVRPALAPSRRRQGATASADG